MLLILSWLMLLAASIMLAVLVSGVSNARKISSVQEMRLSVALFIPWMLTCPPLLVLAYLAFVGMPVPGAATLVSIVAVLVSFRFGNHLYRRISWLRDMTLDAA